ncbi:polyadenylate-binding protein-interacting protein 7-like [Salvia miltiorrhiza]|uniref:polyadenylate-binding protein-interacting protein 7-like n=1 Tax=Salvia miltiorrhiza TaxID=226208 RepID=UPI0025AD423C|nr:polyadenylate-binding protein-interacting protein 7-like [Salvia miltiorrhiza]
MNLSAKGASVANKKLSAEATLNPNAAEFVPFALRSQAANLRILDTSPKFTTSGKSVLDRSESSVSNSSNAEEEAQQYWCHQLPDDITPDFKVMGIDNGVNEASRYTSPTNSGVTLKEHQALSLLHPLDGSTRAEKQRYPVSPNGECFQTSLGKPWDRQIHGGSDQLLAREGNPYNGNTSRAFLAEMSNEQSLLDNADLCRLEFLASQFPSFSAESIAEAYLSNGGDLNLTINVLTQLELRVDGGSNQTRSPMAFSSPNLSASKLPTLCVPNGHSGSRKLAGDDQQNVGPYWSPGKESSLRLRSFSAIPLRVATDFASAARKTTSQESSIWKYDRNGSSDNTQVLASAYNSGQVKSIYGNRLQSRGSPLTSPARLETGLSAANMYSEKREEARDHARVHNTYIEQARQAYLAGNKTLAKELSILGQLHSLQMKAANGEAQESVYHQRDSEIISNGTEQMIDLHGLNVSEAIFVLKRELAVLRNAARSVDQRVLVSIGVGAGHHMRGSPTTPARLPVAVQRYLLEEEGLDYSEPRPGLLRVVIY